MDKWTHTTLFDRPYPPEKRAEGLAISEAIVGGHCDECVFLANCITQRTFKFPATAWCMKRKAKILAAVTSNTNTLSQPHPKEWVAADDMRKVYNTVQYYAITKYGPKYRDKRAG